MADNTLVKDPGEQEFRDGEAELFNDQHGPSDTTQEDSVMEALSSDSDQWADPGVDEPSSNEELQRQQEAALEQQIKGKIDDSHQGQVGSVEPTQTPDPTGQNEPPVGEEESQSAFSEDALRMAGLTAEDAGKHFKDEDALLSALAWQDQQAMLLAKNAEMARQQQQQTFTPPVQAPPQHQQRQVPPPQAQPPGGLQQQQPFKVDLDPEEFGQETVDFLNRMNEHYQKQGQVQHQEVAQLKQALAGHFSAMKRQEAEQKIRAFDEKVNALPDQWKETFGQGDRTSLQGTQHFQERARLSNAMTAIASGRHQTGMPPLSQDQLFDRAIRAEFAQQHEQAVRGDVAEKVGKRLGQETSRPTARQGKPLSKEQQAQANVNKRLMELGVKPGGDLMGEINEL